MAFETCGITFGPIRCQEEIFARKSLDQLNAERPLDDVFFDYDQSSIRTDARPALQKNADWLTRWGATQITVEGHCDARGTEEYNLALGQKRAEAARSYLIKLGIAESAVEAITFGEEVPLIDADTDEAYAENRRAEFGAAPLELFGFVTELN